MLTPEQEALRQAAYDYHTNPNPGTAFGFRRAIKPAAILALLAQVEAAPAPSETSIQIPQGIDMEQMRAFIISHADQLKPLPAHGIAMPPTEMDMLKRQIHNLKRHIEDYCPAGQMASKTAETRMDTGVEPLAGSAGSGEQAPFAIVIDRSYDGEGLTLAVHDGRPVPGGCGSCPRETPYGPAICGKCLEVVDPDPPSQCGDCNGTDEQREQWRKSEAKRPAFSKFATLEEYRAELAAWAARPNYCQWCRRSERQSMSKGSIRRPGTIPAGKWEAIFRKPPDQPKEPHHATDADEIFGNTPAVPSVGAVDQE